MYAMRQGPLRNGSFLCLLAEFIVLIYISVSCTNQNKNLLYLLLYRSLKDTVCRKGFYHGAYNGSHLQKEIS
jgi:hypothetical protein